MTSSAKPRKQESASSAAPTSAASSSSSPIHLMAEQCLKKFSKLSAFECSEQDLVELRQCLFMFSSFNSNVHIPISEDAEALVWLIKFLEFVLVKSYQAQLNDETGVLVDADSVVSVAKKQPARKTRTVKKTSSSSAYVVSARVTKTSKSKTQQSLDSDGENESVLNVSVFPLIQSIAIYRDHILPLMESQRAGMKFLVELMTQAYIEIMSQHSDPKQILEAMFDAKNSPIAQYVKSFGERKKKLMAIGVDMAKLQKDYAWDLFVEQLRDIVNLSDYDEDLDEDEEEVTQKMKEKTKKTMAELTQEFDVQEESEDEWAPVKPKQLVQSLSDRQVLSIAHPGALAKAGIQIESPNNEEEQSTAPVDNRSGILKRSHQVAAEEPAVQRTPVQLRGNHIPGFTPGRVDEPLVEDQRDGVDRRQLEASGQQDSMESLQSQQSQNENVNTDQNVSHADVIRIVVDGEERFINHNKRRKKLMWTQQEVDLLEEGMKLYGCKWTKIRDWANTDRAGFSEHRTAPDLKDKARVERNRRLKYGESLGIFALMNPGTEPAAPVAQQPAQIAQPPVQIEQQ